MQYFEASEAFTGLFPEVFEGKENQSFLYIAAKILNSSGFEKQNYGNWFLSWEVFLVNVVHYGTLSPQVWKHHGKAAVVL